MIFAGDGELEGVFPTGVVALRFIGFEGDGEQVTQRGGKQGEDAASATGEEDETGAELGGGMVDGFDIVFGQFFVIQPDVAEEDDIVLGQAFGSKGKGPNVVRPFSSWQTGMEEQAIDIDSGIAG